jgi:hypothetical protein
MPRTERHPFAPRSRRYEAIHISEFGYSAIDRSVAVSDGTACGGPIDGVIGCGEASRKRAEKGLVRSPEAWRFDSSPGE